MATSDISNIRNRVLYILGAHNNAWPATLSDDRLQTAEINRAIVETEAEIVQALCSSYHPMRTSFLTWSAVVNGAEVPEHIGQIESVEITPYSGGTVVLGEATSRSNIQRWRENHNNIFDTIAHSTTGSNLAGYYNLTNNTLTFTGLSARVRICSYSPDYATPALKVNDQFDSMLVAGTIPKLNKLGVPQALVSTYGQAYMNLLGLIKQGVENLPEIPEAQQHE